MTCRKGTVSRKGLAIVYRAALGTGRVCEESRTGGRTTATATATVTAELRPPSEETPSRGGGGGAGLGPLTDGLLL